ncbi:MAG: hypothetical protein V8S27_05320 [Lachnospiraceae bacterium]
MSACARHETTTRAEKTSISAETSANETGQMTSMPNPFIDHTTLADAQNTAGFSFKIPGEIQGVSANVFRTLNKELIEVIYLKDYDANDANSDQTTASADDNTSEPSTQRSRGFAKDSITERTSAEITPLIPKLPRSARAKSQ